MEIWKNIYHNGIITDKLVSNKGRVKNTLGKELKLADNGAGYFTAAVFSYKDSDGKWRSHRNYIHRLVAEYFIDNPSNLPQVNHKDCDKSNNCVSNLEWISKSENILHAHVQGRMSKRSENADITILTVEQVIELYTSVVRDNIGISEKARQMSLPRTTASSIINKRSRFIITDKLDEYFKVSTTGYPRLLDLGFKEGDDLRKMANEKCSTN